MVGFQFRVTQAAPAADATVVGWLEDVLGRALIGQTDRVATADTDVSATGRRRHRDRSHHVHITWRHELKHAIHAIRAQDGLGLSSDSHPIPLERLQSTLDSLRDTIEPASTATYTALFVDDFVTHFAPTLAKTLTAFGVHDARSPLMLSTMTGVGVALLDAYSHAIAVSAATVPELVSSMPMEDFYSMFNALGGSGGVGGGGGRQRLSETAARAAIAPELAAAIGSNRNATRNTRRRKLLEHVAREWPRAVVARSAHGAPPSAWLVAAISASPCALVSNLDALCASLIGTRHASAFAEVAANGCRCAPVAAAAMRSREGAATIGAAVVGTHHKTGTVLLEEILLGATRDVLGGAMHKPGWKECASAIAAARPSAIAAPLPAPLRVPDPRHPLARIFCVDEHAKSLPRAASPMAYVHVLRDPLEVCASSYQYALRTTEAWIQREPRDALGGRSYQQYYRSAPLRDGLAAECRRCFKELRQTAALYEATRRDPRVLTIRFEQLADDYDSTVHRMLGFLGLADGDPLRAAARFGRLVERARRFDLSRNAPNGDRLQGHVSNSSQKAELRALLLDPAAGLFTELQALRGRLGYPAQFVAAVPSATAELQQQWRRATMIRP